MGAIGLERLDPIADAHHEPVVCTALIYVNFRIGAWAGELLDIRREYFTGADTERNLIKTIEFIIPFAENIADGLCHLYAGVAIATILEGSTDTDVHFATSA